MMIEFEDLAPMVRGLSIEVLGFWLAFALALGSSAGRALASKAASDQPAVRTLLDIPYYSGKSADPIKHKLDLYLPAGEKEFPVLFFVHGGAWRHGDKNFFGMYRTMGSFWARHGIGAVIVNYRLSPAVMHPE